MDNSSELLSTLIKLLNEIKPIGNEIQAMLENSFKVGRVKKGKIILKETEVCENLWFLANGLLRSYHKIGNKEVTSRIMFTNHIVIAAGSFFKQTPATESIEALSDCTLLSISFSSLQKIYKEFPQFNLHTRIITEDYFYKQELRLYMLRQPDALSKYNYFIENYHSYLKDIPLMYIASFINITPETLSRLRRNKMNNSS
jgi:CRP/FNR family transcriptional regulator, anaerobic regulatory protein